TLGCQASLPDPALPLARTPDAAFRRQAPERLEGAAPVRLPPVRTERLENGLLVVVATRPNSPSTHVELVVRGAGIATSEGSGVAVATVFALAEAPEATFSADVNEQAAYLGIDTDAAGLDAAVEEIANAALRPNFDESVVNATRGHLAGRLARERERNLFYAKAYARLYAEPPVLLDAPEASIYAITKITLEKQYDRFYGPENAALIVAGPAPFEGVMSAAIKHFAGWKAGTRPAPKPPTGLPLLVPSIGPRPVIAVDAKQDMAYALLVLPGPPRGFPGFPEYMLADILLGSSLGSRGNVALRLHDAKTYGVSASLERRRTGSELQVQFAVEQDDLVESLQRMLGEIERLRSEPVSTEELEAAKIAWKARLSSRLVTSSGTVALLREEFAVDADPSVLKAIVENVERTKPADILAVARREFTPDRMLVVVFASREKVEAALRHVGPIGWQDESSD
ncbi:MAG TPA: pitrilysin family protein, partial [Polyangiaceae bacterium]